jgi:hypothetical protein
MEAMIIASAATAAFGAIKQGQAQEASYKAQAQAQDYNATMARNNAQMASEQANAAEEQQRRKFGALQGQAIAGIAQSGTGFDGSNADILKQNAIANELDALTIRYQGQNQSKGLLAQADLDTYGAGVSRMNASSAMTGAYLNAGSQLLSGASKYNYYSRTGKMAGMD